MAKTKRPKIGRPPKPDAERLHPVAVRLDSETVARLDAVAEREGIGRHVLARECLLDGLDRSERKAPKKGATR